MGKTLKDFHFKERIPIPRPGKAHPTERDYNRKRDKKVIIHTKEEDYDND